MQNFYLIRWLKENSRLDPDIIDALKYELDKRLYYYGEQFAYPAEKSAIAGKFGRVRAALKEKVLSFNKLRMGAPGGNSGIRISSNAYFSFNSALTKRGFSVINAPWNMGRGEFVDAGLYRRIRAVRSFLENADFKELITDEFAAEMRGLKAGLKEYYLRAGISALVVPFDLPVFEQLAIKIFKELGLPSFISLHGLPGRYNNIDDNRTDHLLVWGDKIKEFYVRAGISPEKIIVTGHPSYKTLPAGAPRFSLDNVLVISKSMGGTQHSAEEILSDRGNLVLYLYSVQKALEKAGVRQARLRLHPSESERWYRRFVDEKFFVPDREGLCASLTRSTLVIGPTSTVFLESLLAGVNYVIYEPAAGNMDLVNYPLVPPFDGTEQGIPAAQTEEALEKILNTRSCVSPAVLGGYIKNPFDLSFIEKIVSPK
ncbi:MAG: hypothetical protein A2270_11870 [Elusimicrobia bacterium RIFOXYA12_FULL_51_18]|nr:MAG: hypothetical protein A2270_11870 [Elusimicrobia bacterium RIFOXYA12_FULL_51_18]OGS32883.1 MAG: hypothetical protein A2218_10790 [Elusimicrobia bacterium RIFOXYA2_FULL_53_38]